MSISTLICEMIVIFVMISIGYGLKKTGHVQDSSMQSISYLISYVTNPCLCISVALSYEGALPVPTFLNTFKWCLLLYAILIGASYLIVFLLRVPRKDRFVFQMLTVYGNTGFIGLPICRAVFGEESLVFVTINNIIFGLIIYTYGTAILRKAKKIQDQEAAGGPGAVTKDDVSFIQKVKRIFNVGTIASFIAIAIYLFDPKLPSFVPDIFSYVGEPTIFLSLFILGCSVASAPLMDFITGDKKMFLFLAIRMLALPILITLLLKQFIRNDAMLLGTLMIMVSLPGGNMPLILSREMGLNDRELSRGIILSTLLCIVTIPIVALFL